MTSTSSNKYVKLSNALGLRPLDRLQLNNAQEIREMHLGSHPSYKPQLPFMYFQRVCAEELLEVCSPSGYLTKVAPTDICDIIPAEPLIVRAMPQSVFMARTKLSVQARQAEPGPECYAPAYVMRVSKDRWGRVDQVHVNFVDRSLNAPGAGVAPIHSEDRRALNDVARRDVMPVMSPTRSGAGYSADKGVEQKERLAHNTARGLIRCAVRGYRQGVEQLAMAGVKKINQAALNRIYAEAIAPLS